MPAEADASQENLDKLDRAVAQQELGQVAIGVLEIQGILDQANLGSNPLGFNDEALVFDTDPFYDGVIWERRTHFEQLYDRALIAAKNALEALAMASQAVPTSSATSEGGRIACQSVVSRARTRCARSPSTMTSAARPRLL